ATAEVIAWATELTPPIAPTPSAMQVMKIRNPDRPPRISRSEKRSASERARVMRGKPSAPALLRARLCPARHLPHEEGCRRAAFGSSLPRRWGLAKVDLSANLPPH